MPDVTQDNASAQSVFELANKFIKTAIEHFGSSEYGDMISVKSSSWCRQHEYSLPLSLTHNKSKA